MTSTSELLSRYQIGRKQFYQRRDCLIKLGYDLQGQKVGRKSTYTPEQVELLDHLDQHIQSGLTMDTFPPVITQPPMAEGEQNGNGHGFGSELVSMPSSPVEIASEQNEEIEVDVDRDPLEDIREQQYQSVHVAAQYNAAQNLAAFNYLTLDYMKHREFTVDGLAEQVHKSSKAVRESLASMMESPEQATKKLLNKIRQRRNK